MSKPRATTQDLNADTLSCAAWIARLLKARERVAIVEETHLGPGVGSELAASLLEQSFAGRVMRIATPPVPIPAARSLEAQLLPDEDELFRRLACFITEGD